MSDSSLRPGAERRRQLRQERRADRLLNLWRLVVFSTMAGGLGYGLLTQGWTLRSPSQVEVSGSRLVSRDQVIQAAGLSFPQPLLALQPRQIIQTLSTALPVENVRVSRLMLPPRLRVELVDRSAVARAERRNKEGLEQGYVDRLGNWISLRQNLGVRLEGTQELRVVGWNERHRPALAKVLQERPAFGGKLQEIRFDPEGSLWLNTTDLGPVRLGPADGQLERRLAVAAHLNATLPADLRGRRPQIVDLSDPDQPELSLTGLKPVTDPGPATAVRPRGGQ
ncbi:cell division protein FtsQ/DivIB [Vulcanococcus limneticus]|uniref:cell division protein FtsQ/DivIB n=1 Tax=Vulcanococcus limneticus TaxID=2170428 RepID=UPI00398BCB5E